MKTANILSIDGGGIKGILPLMQLIELEKMLKAPLSEHFDYISGTSTGGIIAVLLSIGYNADEILNLYVQYGDQIFQKEFLRFGIFRTKYDDNNFNNIIDEYVKNKHLTDCKTSILIPAYNASKNKLELFKHNVNRKYEYWQEDLPLFDVIRSTASAPSFFKPWIINSDKYIDGGLVVNNPSQMTMLEAMKDGFDKINILSFSTGSIEKPITNKLSKSGMLGWAEPTVDILLSEMTQTTDYTLEHLFNCSPSFMGRRLGLYIRCNSLISKSSGKLDDVSKLNIRNMIDDGKESARINKEKMRAFYINTLK